MDKRESTTGWLTRELDQLPQGERRDALGKRLHEQIADVLEIGDPQELDPNRPLFEMGLTSVRAVEVRDALSSSLAVPLPATLLFDQPTIEALTSFLAHQILGLPAPQAPPVAVDAARRLMETIDQLSDEEAAALMSGSESP